MKEKKIKNKNKKEIAYQICDKLKLTENIISNKLKYNKNFSNTAWLLTNQSLFFFLSLSLHTFRIKLKYSLFINY